MLCVCVVVIDDYVMYVEDGMIVMYVFILLGVNWEVQVFDLWDLVYCQELFVVVGIDIYVVVLVKVFEDEDLG